MGVGAAALARLHRLLSYSTLLLLIDHSVVSSYRKIGRSLYFSSIIGISNTKSLIAPHRQSQKSTRPVRTVRRVSGTLKEPHMGPSMADARHGAADYLASSGG